MRRRHKGELVLAIRPSTRGFAFALFEGPLSPLNWGTRGASGSQRNARLLEAFGRLVENLQPDVLVLEDLSAPTARRSGRSRRLQRLIAGYAEGQAIEVRSYSRTHIRECFAEAGAVTRHEIASAIAARVHALKTQLPPARKPWMNEDTRMHLFDAVSLVMTFYCKDGRSAVDERAAG
ncbi:MAG: hypothetical protein P4L72_15800 [Parvibaculum sp.]|uniref:hypothetical protein n=1 Tax=Parvibaculum sp. TaxID=2024848 RepID=UPI002848DCD5|nr:hypothetical protein [Parvibaculum sp.]MDR3500678.1 hypothetical protein [Parvibaculum sp.]